MTKRTAPAPPALLHVYRVARPDYDVPSIGPDGADLPADEARALLERGLVTLDQPAAPAAEGDDL